MNDLVENNLGLVATVAKKFIGRGTEYEDLFQIGCLGLIEASKNFKPELGYAFSTYAVWFIRGKLLLHFRDNNIVHIPHHIRDKYINTLYKLKEKLKREPTIEEIHDHTGLTEKEIIKVQNALCNATSTNAILNSAKDKDITLEDTLKSHFILENEVIHKLEIKKLYESIDNLPEKQKKVILLRLQEKTQVEIGEIVGVKQVQVSRLIKKAIINLRKLMGSDILMIKKNEAIKLIKQGLSNQQIAERLDSSPSTISVYRTQYNNSMKNKVFALFDTGKDVPQIVKDLCINGNTIFKFKEEWLRHHKETKLNIKNDPNLTIDIKKDFQEIAEREKVIQKKKIENKCITGNGTDEALHFKTAEDGPKQHVLKATQYKGLLMDYNINDNSIEINSKENAGNIDVSKESIDLFIQELKELKEAL